MASIARSCDDCPLTAAHELLDTICLNITEMKNQLRTVAKSERQRLQRELKEARRQEKEVKSYV